MRPDGAILILRARNSARSRMAEALVRKHCGAQFQRECPKLFPGAVRRYSRPVPHSATVEGALETKLAAFRELGERLEQRILERLRAPDAGLVGARA